MIRNNVESAAETGARMRAARRRIGRFARLLDSGIGIPGTRVRIGIESLIGLLPVAGDVAGLLRGLYFLYEGFRLRLPARQLAGIAGRIVLDALVGLVPVLGDAVDVLYRSNQRNARVLEAHLDQMLGSPGPAARGTPRLLRAGAIVAAAAGGYALGRWLLAGGFPG